MLFFPFIIFTDSLQKHLPSHSLLTHHPDTAREKHTGSSAVDRQPSVESLNIA